MKVDSSSTSIDPWLDRIRRMTEYRAEAADFIRRAGSVLPAADADVELVCRLWTEADEHDTLVCEALQKFDDAVFKTSGELEITRGAEPISNDEGDVVLSYLCTWTLARPDSQSASVVLSADQVSCQLMFEIRDSTGLPDAPSTSHLAKTVSSTTHLRRASLPCTASLTCLRLR